MKVHLVWDVEVTESLGRHDTGGDENTADADVVDVVVRGIDGQELEETLHHVVLCYSLHISGVPAHNRHDTQMTMERPMKHCSV